MKSVKIGFAPTRRSIFSAPDAVKYANLTRERLKELGVEFVDITDINEEGLFYDEADREKIQEKFRRENVKGIFFPHGNFGTEYVCARLAKEMGLPVLLWGPRDERPDENGVRLRDSQCGLFATGKVLRRFGVPFTYMTNCRLTDPEFERGIQDFLAVCNVVDTFRHTRILQIGPRPFDFWSTMCNEGELLYMYNIVKPKCAMPIHGENRHLVANGLIAVKTGVDPQNVVLAEDGDVVDLYHGRAAVVGSVPCGYVYVDGDSVGELTDDELEKRRILGTEGFVSAFVVVDTDNHEVVTGPKIYLNAVAEDESEFDKVRHQIVEQLNDQMMQGTRDTYKLQQTMRRTLGSWVARQLHRKPMIVPVVADIAQDVETVETK